MSRATTNSDSSKEVTCKIGCAQQRYYNSENNYGIYVVVPDLASLEESIPMNDDGTISVKGYMMPLDYNKTYQFTGVSQPVDQYGVSYIVESVVEDLHFDVSNRDGQKEFLKSVFTEKQVEAMYDALIDPFKAFMEHKAEQLIQIKGCKLNTVSRWMDKFDDTLPMYKLFTELPEFKFTYKQMQNIIQHWNGVDLAVTKIRENPYSLLQISGFGWKRVDDLIQKKSPDPYNMNRVQAFVRYYLDSCGQNGDSYISSQELIDAMVNNLGEDIPDMTILESVKELESKEIVWFSVDRQNVGLMKYHKIAERLATEIKRIMNGKNGFEHDNWRDKLKHIENIQGWNYTSEQIEGIRKALENNFSIIIGSAGTGKSSTVAGVLEILKGYRCVSVALAGKAAEHVAQISNGAGSTIHRLLGYPLGDKETQGFVYHRDNPLDVDIIIIDEISMINANLFYYLLRAVADNKKVICLGDTGQLESIGEGAVARDMIESGVIPVTTLNEIHRQAKKSGIITESIKVRHGKSPLAKDALGQFTFGELQDLVFDTYNDKANTFSTVMKHFVEDLALENNNIMNVQVLVPIKERGDASVWKLNQTIQEIYNPSSKDKPEIVVNYGGYAGILRLGDKVICTRNNHKMINPDTEEKVSVFNGNVGIVEAVGEDYIVVDFEGIGAVEVPKKFLQTIDLAYAITVHKEQGSSAKRIIFGFDFTSYALLSRQLVYTGITRAEKHCTICCDIRALQYACKNDAVTTKRTHLKEILAPTQTDRHNIGF